MSTAVCIHSLTFIKTLSQVGAQNDCYKKGIHDSTHYKTYINLLPERQMDNMHIWLHYFNNHPAPNFKNPTCMLIKPKLTNISLHLR